MGYALQKRDTTSAGATVQDAMNAGTASNAQLKGMSYAEGAQALSPDAIQMKPAGGGVQRKIKLKDDDNVKKKDMPDEIKALNLKKVKVKLEVGQWEHLDDDEKEGVCKFLSMKEAEIASPENQNKKSGKIKRCNVTINGRHLKAQDDEEIESMEAASNKNVDGLNNGEAPARTHRKGRIIGVDPGNIEVTQSYSTKTEMVGKKERVTSEADFKSGESTFLSAEYTQEKMLANAEIMKVLEEVKAQIETYLSKDPNAKITVNTQGSESAVTPPASHPNVGDLAQARCDNGDALIRSYLEGIEGLDMANVEFTKENLCEKAPAGPAWDPTGLSKSEVNALKMSDTYTRWQYVKFQIKAEMMVTSDEKVPVPTEEVDETTTADADIVFMTANDKKKHKKSRGKDGHVGNQGMSKGAFRRQEKRQMRSTGWSRKCKAK